MNKKLIALVVAGALGTPMVASANATFYGRIGAELGSTKIDQAGTAGYRQETIGDNTGISRFGWNVTEDLGGGLSANARIEFAFRAGNGTGDTAREQWVGLSSKSWGALQFGRVHSPFKDFAGGTTIDPFNTTNLQARGSGGALYTPANGFGAGAFVDHAIRYNSPSFGGFSASVLLAPTDATQTDATTGGGNVGGRGGSNNYQIGLKYKIGTSGEVFGGYSNDEANNAQSLVTTNGRRGDDETVWRLGTAWSFGDFRIAAQYDKIKDALAGNGGTSCGGGAIANGAEGASTAQCNTALNTNGEGDIWFLTTQYKIGQTTVVLQGGQTKADAIGVGAARAVERESKNITLGAIYNLSKRSRVFGGYQRVSIDGGRDVANTINSTGAQVNAATTVQPDRSTFTIGMRHDF